MGQPSAGPSFLEVGIEVAPEAAEAMAATAGDFADGVEIRDAETVIRAAAGRALVIVHVAPAARDELLAAVDEAAALMRAAGVPVDPVVVRERAAHEDEWRDVWKRFFRATRVGRTLLVRPSWDLAPAAEGDRVIDIDPGRAFGTGGHASTRLVMQLAEELALAPQPKPVRRFLDLGCGSGILSIAAARLWPEATGVAADVDADAVACAAENLELNRITSVSLATGSIDALSPEIRFDLVMANIQADVLAPLAPALAARLTEGGVAILSGLLLGDADPVLRAFNAAGLALRQRRDDGEWAALEVG